MGLLLTYFGVALKKNVQHRQSSPPFFVGYRPCFVSSKEISYLLLSVVMKSCRFFLASLFLYPCHFEEGFD
jgi:hypothetical protein